MLGLLRGAVIGLTALICSLYVSAQSTSVQELGIGKILVARRHAPDPTFAETVILLVRYTNDGTVGLVINRRTNVPISQALRGLNGSKQRSEPVYLGGPVETQIVMALLRAKTMPDEAAHVVGKVYLLSNKSVLEKSLTGRAAPTDFHVYLGYTGWSKRQLEAEVRRGFWDILPANGDLAFDPEPDTLWSRLIARTEQRIARVQIPRAPMPNPYSIRSP
jgi:putative AlgH/UPF0301 family transcriptional regulator